MTRASGYLLVAAIAGFLGAGEALAEDALVLNDFESEKLASFEIKVMESWIEHVEDGDEGRCLRWIHEEAGKEEGGWIDVFGVPKSWRPFHAVRFRARAVGDWDGAVEIRLRSSHGYLRADLPPVGEAWTTHTLRLADMKSGGVFDPDDATVVRFACWGTKGFELELDDICLLKGEGGWGRADAETTTGSAQDPEAPVWTIANFETEGYRRWMDVNRSRVETVEPAKRKDSRCCCWQVEPTEKTVWIEFLEVPPSLQPYRLLRFKARAPKGQAQEVCIRFDNAEDEYLQAYLPPLHKKGKWTEVEIPLPSMSRTGDPAPDSGLVLSLIQFGSKGCRLELDDIQLVRGANGWAQTKEEHLASLFGEKRVKKVKEIETDHFRIYTDSSGARTKFPRALEKAYVFVRKALDLPEMENPLDVFIFQNSELYFDFCMRNGWTREEAVESAGHAWSGYFATYYQAPNSPVVTHELTHSLVHRTWGSGGGSWYQEGTAVCVEERWQKRDAATLFASRLRSGEYMPLAEFMRKKRLIRSDDVRGGAGTAGALYDQAGAFFEFLMRGPFAERRPNAIRELAKVDWDADTVVERVERIYGTTLLEIETAWKEWGSDPPKLPR